MACDSFWCPIFRFLGCCSRNDLGKENKDRSQLCWNKVENLSAIQYAQYILTARVLFSGVLVEKRFKNLRDIFKRKQHDIREKTKKWSRSSRHSNNKMAPFWGHAWINGRRVWACGVSSILADYWVLNKKKVDLIHMTVIHTHKYTHINTHKYTAHKHRSPKR